METNALERKAGEIAQSALRQTASRAQIEARLENAMRRLVDAGLEAQKRYNGRELMIFEKDFEKIGVLIDALAEGNYAETAATLAGISSASVRSWMASAEKGDPRYALVGEVIQLGAALAETESLGHVRTAGRDPRNWAAAMTFLERRYPGKWGRRPEESDASKITVVIGGDVRDFHIVHLSPNGESVAEVQRAISDGFATGLTREQAIARFGAVAGKLYDDEARRRALDV